jgi:iron(III) transport system substrate-binding protein
MTPSRRSFLLAGSALFATAPFIGRARADAALLTSTQADRQEKLEAAAKAERSMTLYTSISQADVQPVVRPFEEKYGIKVTVWRTSGDTVLQRVVQEQRAGRASVDAIHVGAPEMEAMAREGIFQPVASPYFVDLLPGSVPDHKMWASTLLSVWVQAYNTNLIKKEDLPKSYADLLNPRWKGTLGFEVEDIDWFVAVVRQMGEEEGLKYFRQLVGSNGLSIRKGHALLNTLVAAGEVPLALTVYNYMPIQAKAKGAPIDWFVIDSGIARANGIGVVKNAQRPNAAALFEDYMLSAAQLTLSQLNYVPTSKKIESPLGNAKIQITNTADSLDYASKWEPLYKQIIIKGISN